MKDAKDDDLYTIYEKSSEGNRTARLQKDSRCLLANDDPFLLMAFAKTLKNYFDYVDEV